MAPHGGVRDCTRPALRRQHGSSSCGQDHQRSPPRPEREIVDWLNSGNFDNDRPCREFGLHVSSQLKRVRGHILRSPELRTGGQAVTPRGGGFSCRRVYQGIAVKSWCVVNLSKKRHANVINFVDALVRKAHENNVEFRERNPPVVQVNGANQTEESLGQAMRDAIYSSHDQCPQFMLVILDSKNNPCHELVKRLSDSVLGVTSQCMVGRHVARINGNYLSNLVLKINTKLAGINFELRRPPAVLTDGRTIIFGASAEYPRSPHKPAIAAVVACVNKYGSKYIGREAPLASQDLASALPVLLSDLIAKFKEKRRVTPNKIIFFRDATSDGEMDQVFQSEMTAIALE